MVKTHTTGVLAEKEEMTDSNGLQHCICVRKQEGRKQQIIFVG